eukprot:7383288-Prymnesium_polylepis.1
MRDLVTYAQHGPFEPGVTAEDGWSFCSEPWCLSAAAKAKLLEAEATIRMKQSQASQLMGAMGHAPEPTRQ